MKRDDLVLKLAALRRAFHEIEIALAKLEIAAITEKYPKEMLRRPVSELDMFYDPNKGDWTMPRRIVGFETKDGVRVIFDVAWPEEAFK